ncbi:ABC transporter permease [Marinobacterium arenosum]|uniref:ABC transporter permease n=1 Tax=Marinobacterium arenosum TaxID=2862496 RepID=UPI001C950413|nr:ABC transporter permease [Marinobacterium arenosum]MBY4676274.1 ABC transporter permease [Marinobacterium arenosum]
MLISLAWHSLWNRRSSVLLTVLAISISVMLLLGVEKVRVEARSSFANTISGTDLVVGARSGQVQLLLYSVFRIGDATNNISWQSYQEIAGHRNVAWTIPLALGDSHRGFRVLGTNQDYFRHYRYGAERQLSFAEGQPFDDLYDVVLGAEVAQKLGYKLGQQLVIAHGMGNTSFAEHKDKPFRVVGILARTGTPVDSTLHVSLEAIEAIHLDWRAGVPIPGAKVDAEKARALDLQPKQITAFMVGLKSKIATFHLQRAINNYRAEPLSAILPGVALQQLWQMIGIAEQALLVISGFVVLTGLIGMLTVLLSSLNERRREMAILRSVGARPWQIIALLTLETTVLTLLGCLVGTLLLYAALLLAQPWIEQLFGLHIAISALSSYQLQLLGLVAVAGILVGVVPGYRAYRNSLADGLTIRL